MISRDFGEETLRIRRYRLNVIYHTGPPEVSLRNNTRLNLVVRPGSDTCTTSEFFSRGISNNSRH